MQAPELTSPVPPSYYSGGARQQAHSKLKEEKAAIILYSLV